MMSMRGVMIVAFVLAILPGVTWGKSCSKATRDLERLRQDYHKYATSASAQGMPVTFDGLVAILDKIIDLKREMEKLNCPVPPRNNVTGQKR